MSCFFNRCLPTISPCRLWCGRSCWVLSAGVRAIDNKYQRHCQKIIHFGVINDSSNSAAVPANFCGLPFLCAEIPKDYLRFAPPTNTIHIKWLPNKKSCAPCWSLASSSALSCAIPTPVMSRPMEMLLVSLGWPAFPRRYSGPIEL